MTITANNNLRSVLAVDDNPDNLLLLQFILENEGYKVNLANNGQTALVLVKQLHPDLILLDLMMPTMNGYEVIGQIRQDRSVSFIPIMLITANKNECAKEQAILAGANELLYKPFELEELMTKVESLLSRN